MRRSAGLFLGDICSVLELYMYLPSLICNIYMYVLCMYTHTTCTYIYSMYLLYMYYTWCITDGEGQCTGERYLHLGRGPSLQHQPTGRPVIPSVQEYCTCRCTCYMYVHVYAHMYIYVHVLYVHMCVMCRGYYYTYTLYMYMYTILV